MSDVESPVRFYSSRTFQLHAADGIHRVRSLRLFLRHLLAERAEHLLELIGIEHAKAFETRVDGHWNFLRLPMLLVLRSARRWEITRRIVRKMDMHFLARMTKASRWPLRQLIGQPLLIESSGQSVCCYRCSVMIIDMEANVAARRRLNTRSVSRS